MLDVQSLSKTYGKRKIFTDISFTIKQGEIVGLIGENGAGKSTLLSILATLQKPTTGKISLDGLTYTKMRNIVRKKIGYVPQEIALWNHLTVRENMLFFEKLAWNKKSEDELKGICSHVKLNRWEEPVYNLSGGMKRKLNLAISLIHDPDLLLLDEPTVGIDLKSRMEIGTYLKILATDFNKIIMYTSHDIAEIKTLCNRVICIGEDPFYQNLLGNSGKEIQSF